MSASTPAPSDERNRHRAVRTPWPRRRKIVAAVIGAALAGSAAFAATNWLVGLNNGSSSQARSGQVTNISIDAIAAPSPTNLLFPGGTGDVVAKITNPNAFPVTITALTLPANTAFAAGYSDSALTAAQTGCDATTSTVTYAFAGTGGSHNLTSSITVGPKVGSTNGTATITFTNDAVMGLTAPNACQNTYFKMPSFTGVTATAGAATITGDGTNSWTS